MKEACPVNLGPREVQRRLRPGVAMLVLFVGLGIAGWVLGWSKIAGLPLLLLLGLGTLNVLQARTKT